ncbi:MAG: DNA alkylation repair protein [Patescibacteria group bacterium]|nr:DNA alkylation repair protein [Patescibacteria group bacterium]
MGNLKRLKSELKRLSSPERAKVSRWFFKTGDGEYGAGDKFIGVNNPGMRKIAKQFAETSLLDLEKLLASGIHEERQTALFILVRQFERGDIKTRRAVYDFYLKNTRNINNWDLVDLSAYKIIGEYLADKDRSVLYQLAKSKNLWERRIAMISTLAFIRQRQFSDTLKIAEILLHDEHDLIHKAAGWMLREAGKRDQAVLEKFLRKHHKTMPRTMLRYAIEKFSEDKRKGYLTR